MLKSVRINSFRSCENVRLDELGAVTALIGRNAGGKTNILRAIATAAEFASARRVLDASQRDPSDIEIELEIQIEERRYRYELHFSHPYESFVIESLLTAEGDADGVGSWSEIFRLCDGQLRSQLGGGVSLNVGSLVSGYSALNELLPSDHALVESIRPLVTFLRSVRYYPFDEPNEVKTKDFFSSAEYSAWKSATVGDHDAGDSTAFRLLLLRDERQDKFGDLRAALGEDGLRILSDLKIDEASFEGRRDQKAYLPLFQPLDGGEWVPYSYLSLGTRRVLRMIVSHIFDDGSVMLIEHPEDGVHRGLLRKLIDYFVGYGDRTQVILTSHSSIVLNALCPENVRFVEMDHGTTRVRKLDDVERAAAAKYLEESGTLAEFLESVE